jgi:hypothetical protein
VFAAVDARTDETESFVGIEKLPRGAGERRN